MKFSAVAAVVAISATARAHTIFQVQSPPAHQTPVLTMP
jgi:hypothetical protein